MKQYTEPVINYGCKRLKGRPESKQPKNIKKEWFIYYQYTDPETGNKRPFKLKEGINRMHTLEERTIEAEVLRDSIADDLKAGYNPITKTFPHSLPGESLAFDKALDFALEKHKNEISYGTLLNYQSVIKYVKEAASKTGINILPVTEIKRRHIKEILEALQQERTFGNTRYNFYVQSLSALFTTLIEWEIVENHPIYRFKKKNEEEQSTFRPFNSGQKVDIFNELERVNPAFLTYVLVTYYSGIRPKEALSMKVKDYLRNDQLFKLEAKNTKGKKKGRISPVPDQLAVRIEKHIEGQDPEKYIFSTGFLPGINNVLRSTATELWKKLIIDGLGLKVKMYSAKHTGGNDRAKKGITLEEQREIFGHSSVMMSEIYASNNKEIVLKQINSESPGFLD